MPPKNIPIPPALRNRCQTYLKETHHSKWCFNDFWGGDESLLSGCGLIWLKELEAIINNSTADHSKCVAAVATRNKYKQREHLPETSRSRNSISKGSSKRRKKGSKLNLSEPPPSYEKCSQEDKVEKARSIKSKNLYKEQYRALSAECKWYLPSGRAVEDVLFTWAMTQSDETRLLGGTPGETYAHSYILDIGDPVICALFTPEEWDAIVLLLLPSPIINDSLVSYMHEFADVETTDDLRHKLREVFYLPPGESYCREKHGDQAWVYSVLTSLAVLYEHDHLRCTANLETWFQINIWGPIFDRCFQDYPNMSITRSEVQSPLNSGRKYFAISARKPIGNRYDGLITHNGAEYGAVEDSKSFNSEKSKKWTSDSLKVVKLLHDQMRGLEAAVRHDRGALSKFRCVGFLTAGLHCQGLFLQYGRGCVCLLQRSGRCTVPKSAAPMSNLIEVLVMVWRMREAVRMSVDNLAQFLGNSEVLFRAAVGQEVREIEILPMCLDTDGEL